MSQFKLTHEQRKDVLYCYFVKKMSLRQIYNNYSHLVRNEYIQTLPSKLMNIKLYNDYVALLLMGKQKYDDFYNGKCLGNKNVSYWENESELCYICPKYEKLSNEEKLIYNG